MFVQKETINEHFKKEKANTGIGRGKFFKKIEMIVMLKSGKIANLFVSSKKLNVWQYLWFCCLFVLSLGNFLFLA